MNANDSLQKENQAKEREIRKLSKDIQKYEQTIVNLRSEISTHAFHKDGFKKDAEVMVGMCCTKSECGVYDAGQYGSLLKDEVNQDRIRKMDQDLKCAADNVRALLKANVTLSEELHALRRVCAALERQCCAAASCSAFKDEIIHEMRRQLKQAKAKLKETQVTSHKAPEYDDGEEKLFGGCRSLEDVPMCVQPRRYRGVPHRDSRDNTRDSRDTHRDSRETHHGSRDTNRGSHDAPLHPDSDDCHSPRFDGSGDDTFSRRQH